MFGGGQVTAHPEVFEGSASYPSPSPGPVLTIGNFDGVHRGHLHLLGRLVDEARAAGGPACVYTFDPAPRDVLRPGNPIPRIQTLGERIACLGRAGVDHVVVEPFTRALGALDAQAFAKVILRERLGVRGLVVGYDFRFGRGREGTVDDLRRVLGVPIAQVDPHAPGGEVISSSRIRQAVRDGDVREAARLLGRAHVVSGTVVRGDARGRALGFPTANLAPHTALVPANGIYAVWVELGDGVRREGAASLGVRPTFADGDDHRVEVHLLDFSGDLYGREARVEFVERLRGEEAFATPEALIARIAQDVRDARAVLRAEGA